jgi:hypothetical protein
VAGIEVDDRRCLRAAPILKWAEGKGTEWLRDYFRYKNWQATVIDPQKHDVQL